MKNLQPQKQNTKNSIKTLLFAIILFPVLTSCSVTIEPGIGSDYGSAQSDNTGNTRPATNSNTEPATTVFTNPQIEGLPIDACVASQTSTTDGSDCSQDGSRGVANTFCQTSGFSKANDFRILKREWSNNSTVSKLLHTGEWFQTEGGFIFSQINCE